MPIVAGSHCAPAPRGADAHVSQLARAAAGDHAAFQRIFQEHAPGVRRYLVRLLGDRELADEATQETFVRAHKRLGSVREPEKLGSWLLGVARRVSLETHRRRGRRFRGRSRVEDRTDLVDKKPTPEASMMSDEAHRAVRSALNELPHDRRAAFLLRMDHGLSYPEIAEQLGWSLAKVKNELHRGRQTLRSRLAPYYRSTP